jgi:two-component system chemotaxis response regulator CheY
VKILIVDDSLMDRKLLTSVLKKNGVTQEILEAVNGEEGVRILGEKFKDICLILLDWQMPIMDGIEFMKAVVKVPEVANMPIVMITASGSEDNKRLAREVNPNLAGYIVKPYKADALIETIKPYLK